MKVIWKHVFEIADRFTAILPVGFRIVHVALQDGCPCLWFECDPAATRCDYTFAVVGTGHQIISPIWHYYGTIQQPPFVWHLYGIDTL